ncbi:hypothetical protein [Actinoplanes sp. NPDC051859]|uniref:hypothetical protein n=1 Tax=Actinoplanes sp. NPDC051859 TaxID=3363909 RepID=UPI0037BBB602
MGFLALIYLIVGVWLAALVAYVVVRHFATLKAAVLAGTAIFALGALAAFAVLSAALTTM